MINLLAKVLEQLNGAVFTLVVILGAVFFGIYRLGKLNEKFSHHQKKIEKVDAISDTLISLTTKVDLIYQNTNPRAMTAAQSPISLTEKGKATATDIHASEIFEKYKGRLVGMVEANELKNAYDIQVASMLVAKDKMIDLLDANEINTIKTRAFSNGILVEDIMGIFGVYLRDFILEQKGIPIAEVDKNIPEPHVESRS